WTQLNPPGPIDVLKVNLTSARDFSIQAASDLLCRELISCAHAANPIALQMHAEANRNNRGRISALREISFSLTVSTHLSGVNDACDQLIPAGAIPRHDTVTNSRPLDSHFDFNRLRIAGHPEWDEQEAK